MEKIYSEIKPELLLHVINRIEDIGIQRQDLTPEKEYLQAACFSMEKGKEIRPHKHVKQMRVTDRTQESWIVIRGSIKITLYDIDDKPFKETTLSPGDCLITFKGGHKFEVLEDNTTIYEYKTGPYLGKESDSVSIDNNL